MRAAQEYDWDAAGGKSARYGGTTDYVSPEGIADYFASDEDLLLSAPSLTSQGKPKASDVAHVRRRWAVEGKFPAEERAAKWTLMFVARESSAVDFRGNFIFIKKVGLNWELNAEAPVLPAWVSDLYNSSGDLTTRAKLRQLIIGMRELLVRRDFLVIDAILRTARLSEFAADIVMGLFRASAVARDHLPSWASGVSRALEELRRRGLPAEAIMAGLLDVADEAGGNSNSR